ncbi:hypothetical protein CspeluHIS016_0211730 [Cutaneotrichosporon spelunceum]|uniref:Uncharacterized protein n=1 Tax=Cutaneotrichosporon spelunceum TaxID=1672016 RepID=A0AAD3TSM7_9TREE|nr:hypothetical protein CspeluHIS016_0211730 [Cutaneotrichosporon spelunceum]
MRLLAALLVLLAATPAPAAVPRPHAKDTPIYSCRTCVRANAANDFVQSSYASDVEVYWTGYYVKYCEATGGCPMCDSLTQKLPSLQDACLSKKECDGVCAPEIWEEIRQCKSCAADYEKRDYEATMDSLLNGWYEEHCSKTTTTDCGAECESIGRAMNDSCTNGQIACHGLCPYYGSATNCWTCQNKFDLRYAYPQKALEFYCGDSCGKDCGWVGDTYAQQCANLDDPSECVLCRDADARATLDRCNSCLPGSQLYTEQKATVLASLATVYGMCNKDGDPLPGGCEKPCQVVTTTYPDLCGGQDATKCRGICPMEVCGTCAVSNESVYSDNTRALIQQNVVDVRNWCAVVIMPPPGSITIPGAATPSPNAPDSSSPYIPNPSSVKVPDPSGIRDIVDSENKNPPPRNVSSKPSKNPFGNTSIPLNLAEDKSNNQGIPAWGIGVAVAGSVVVVAGLAAAVIANGYECDHDHRRLRRKQKKKKKKRRDDDDMPPPEMQEGQKPHIVGYMLPTQAYAAIPTHDPGTSQYPQYSERYSEQYPQQYTNPYAGSSQVPLNSQY